VGNQVRGDLYAHRFFSYVAPLAALDVDPQPWEGKPPSAYAEVILNGKLVYRTRTKQLSPAPYWNATGERFIRDWTKARLVVVVRDERDREHGESYLGYRLHVR
jgi:hypothetical protein